MARTHMRGNADWEQLVLNGFSSGGSTAWGSSQSPGKAHRTSLGMLALPPQSPSLRNKRNSVSTYTVAPNV